MELNENLSLGDMAGMGEVSLPTETSVGSGDIPAGKGDAEEEYKKKRNKKKQRKMKNIISFESFGSANEGMSKSAVKKAIKVIDKQIDTETGGDGEPLDNETLQALEQERERLEGLLSESVVDEGKTISSSKISMMGAKILNKISIGTIFDTEDGNYEITDYGQQANAFKEFEAEHNGKKVKVKLTAMYGVKLEVTDDVRSARFNKEVRLNSIILESLNEGKFDGIGDLVKSLHFEMDPKTAEEKKIELGKRQGEVTKRKQIDGGNYALRRFRKEIKYWDGNRRDQEWAEGIFAGPEHYNTVKSTLGAGPHKKAAKKVRWTQKKYDQWLEDVASNDGWKNAFDMAQNAQFEPGLIDWVEKNFRGEDAMQRIQWDIEAFAESTTTKLTHLKSINEDAVLDKQTDDEIFDSETYYTISKVLSIARKSKECKEEYKRETNFGSGLQMAERLKKEFPKIQFRCRVYRSAWNYGGNLCLAIDLRGKSYKHEVFKFQSNNSTRKPNYSFAKLFNGTKKVSTNEVEDEWGMGIVHGGYQSISSFDKFMDDVVGVFKDYKRVNGVEFDMKTILAGFKVNDKILAEWTRLKPRIEKQYDIAKASARKAHRRIELRMPYIRTAEKKVYYKTDEPRELRHPDEYGESAYDIIDGKDYAKYEAAQAKVSDMIEKFCKKHNFEFVWAASW